MTPAEIQQQVAYEAGITLEAMRGPSKRDEFTRPRLIAYRRLRDELGLNFKQIADIFGRSRETVSRGYRSAAKYHLGGLTYASHFRDGRPRYVIEDTGYDTSCWTWLGRCGSDGYAWWKHEGQVQLAHRVSYQLQIGPIPSDLEIDHLCRNRACVNPAHLEAVTPLENCRRRDAHKAAVRTVERLCLSDPDLRNAVDSLSVGLLLVAARRGRL